MRSVFDGVWWFDGVQLGLTEFGRLLSKVDCGVMSVNGGLVSV